MFHDLSPKQHFYTRHLSTPDTCYTRQLLQQTPFYTRHPLQPENFYTFYTLDLASSPLNFKGVVTSYEAIRQDGLPLNGRSHVWKALGGVDFGEVLGMTYLANG